MILFAFSLEKGVVLFLPLTYLISYLICFPSFILDRSEREERKMRVWEMRCRLDLGIIIIVDGWMDVAVAGVVNFFPFYYFHFLRAGALVSFFFSFLF